MWQINWAEGVIVDELADRGAVMSIYTKISQREDLSEHEQRGISNDEFTF